MFPKDFVWGVASSAYQMEGTDPDDGRGKNVWDEFVRSGRVYEQQTADVSCDHMHRYKEDFALMRLLGIKMWWSGLENMQKSLQKISLICVPILSRSMSRSVRLDWDT